MGVRQAYRGMAWLSPSDREIRGTHAAAAKPRAHWLAGKAAT